MRASPTLVFRLAVAVRYGLGIAVAVATLSLHGRPAPELAPPAGLAVDAAFWAIDFAVAAGMWYFRRWARILYFIPITFFVVNLLLRPGPVIITTFFFGLDIIQYILDGVVITMAFSPPVAGLFARGDA
jgi:hypothetical protein